MITVLGLGFVGLTTALGFSKKGFKVYGIDVDRARVESIRRYEVPFYEPHLEDALREELGHNFVVDASLQEAVNDSRAVIICVGTPGLPDGHADLTYLLEAVRAVFEVSDAAYKVLVVKSTVPPSTVAGQVQPFVAELAGRYERRIGLASNPEFLREGHAWEDFMQPDRVVVGMQDEEAKQVLGELYLPFNAPVHFVDFSTAEFVKYLSNTLLSTLVSFSNEMAMIAEHIGGIDVPAAFRLLHQDRRWTGAPAPMASYVFPGCGYGGYCLPKDTAALHRIAQAHGYEPRLLPANLQINEDIKDFVVDKLTRQVPPTHRLGILGLSFKSGSDDVRLSPSRAIIEKLMQRGYTRIVAYDPMANEVFARETRLPIAYADSLPELVERADDLVLLTGWPEFRQQHALLSTRPLFDFRYALSDLRAPAPPVPLAR
ncbi:UDP-glucose/GDP-mannose dehydrogenase family protein [Hymenobacter gummosus]|uniref:UDP-glucose 6-dehydrogenase n=1 Tax=Hymenobacter gummosus TaxID=1776032 RepID=A0A3S0J9D8_9BACT|nr:UDP-glucose/GDP-mannose dehydrogenase family protein [Hymenobacter gummosus]RTQ48964.1 UDP-glucose/GDP-mannose dehydrogenase family protein [Hymenobacter gummosus]